MIEMEIVMNKLSITVIGILLLVSTMVAADDNYAHWVPTGANPIGWYMVGIQGLRAKETGTFGRADSTWFTKPLFL